MPIVVVMGVAGSGKSTVGQRLADALGVPFLDGDDVHPEANVRKMAAGAPLSDEDRWPWLDALRGRIDAARRLGTGLVLASSALREAYRERLGRDGVEYVFLDGPRELLEARLAARTGHYMKPGMLESQLQTLEPPSNALRIDIRRSPDEIVEAVVAQLGRLRRARG